MATTVAQILNAAISTSTANDGGQSPIANDSAELIAVLDRKIKQIYSLVALPSSKGGSASGDYFKTTWTVNVGTPNTTLTALPASPEIITIDDIVITSSGIWVAVVPYSDFLQGLAEFAPAIVILDRKFRSVARVGDPAAGVGLTIFGSYLPGTLTLTTDFVGATTPATSSTSAWPSHVGDPFLVAYMGLYFALKDGTRDASEIQAYQNDMLAAAQTLSDLLGINTASLVATQDE